MYGFYKGDMLIVSYDLSKKLNLTTSPLPHPFRPWGCKVSALRCAYGQTQL